MENVGTNGQECRSGRRTTPGVGGTGQDSPGGRDSANLFRRRNSQALYYPPDGTSRNSPPVPGPENPPAIQKIILKANGGKIFKFRQRKNENDRGLTVELGLGSSEPTRFKVQLKHLSGFYESGNRSIQVTS